MSSTAMASTPLGMKNQDVISLFGVVVGITLLITAVGCGGTVTTVTGKVTYEGAPVKRGVISITPVGGKGKAEGSKILAGVFEVESIEPGSKRISVIGVMGEESAVDEPVSSEDKMAAAPPRQGSVQIPTDAEGNGQTIEVKQGPQAINIELSKPGNR